MCLNTSGNLHHLDGRDRSGSRDFVALMEQNNARTITTKLALTWATLPVDRHASWALRLTDVRGFARHLANINPETEVLPPRMLPPLTCARPYVNTEWNRNRIRQRNRRCTQTGVCFHAHSA